MYIVQVVDESKKSAITKDILDLLPEWFGNEESKKEYIKEVKYTNMWKAVDGKESVGFISIKIHHKCTGDIYVLGVKKEYQHKGVGTKLLETAEKYCKSVGCKRIIVKTLSEEVHYPPYLDTLRFYLSHKFERLITFTEFWDSENPCLMLIKTI